jgi:hypothetical protein
MHINPEDMTSYTTQYKVAFLIYMDNEYCAKLRRRPVIKHECLSRSNLVPRATASGACQSSLDPYNLSCDNEQYVMLNNVAKTIPRQRDRAPCLLTAARLHLNLPPDAPTNWGPIIPNLNNYRFDQMEISSIFLILGIPDWWHQQE